VAALVLLTGCGHGAKVLATAGPTTTVAPSTTTRPRPATFPLTGLPAASPAAASRAALSIKVENTPSARPQAGLDAADLVTEELVEGRELFVVMGIVGSERVFVVACRA
jgi:hypothetical protein